ncbi:macrolide transporter subunit MacA [Planctomyces sp. SH-PL14]|nr:macrolide transporter subunit MacA [Planctomyces sp. SH-PL14]
MRGTPTSLLVIGLLLAGCERKSAPPPTPVAPAKIAAVVSEESLNRITLTSDAVKRLAIETAKIETRSLPRFRPYGAECTLPGGALLIVPAPVAGTVRTPAGRGAFPQPGAWVAINEPLFELLPLLSPERAVLTPAERVQMAQTRNTIAQSRIDADGLVRQAEVQVDAAKIALARAERLEKDKVGTVRAVDDAQAQLSLAQKGLEAAQARKTLLDEASLEGAEAGSLAPLAITAPMAGQIRTTHVGPGEVVSAGNPLFEILNDKVLWLKVPVYAGDLPTLDTSAPIAVTDLAARYSADHLIAKPIQSPPTATPLASAVDLYYEVANPEGALRPGQRLTAQLPVKGATDQATVPWSAVIIDIYGGQWIYERLDEHHFVRRRVEVAWVKDGLAILTRGPAPGTTVVTAGAAEISGAEFGFAK